MEDCLYDIHFQENRGTRRDLKTVLGKYIKINEMKNRKVWLFLLKLVEVVVHLLFFFFLILFNVYIQPFSYDRPARKLTFPVLAPRTRLVPYPIILWSLTRYLSFSAPSRRSCFSALTSAFRQLCLPDSRHEALAFTIPSSPMCNLFCYPYGLE